MNTNPNLIKQRYRHANRLSFLCLTVLVHKYTFHDTKEPKHPLCQPTQKLSLGARRSLEVKRIEDLEAKSSPEGAAGTGGSRRRKSGFVSTCFSLEVNTFENPLDLSRPGVIPLSRPTLGVRQKSGFV